MAAPRARHPGNKLLTKVSKTNNSRPVTASNRHETLTKVAHRRAIMAKATVAPRTASTQEKSTPKQTLSIVPKTEEPRKGNGAKLIEIVAYVSADPDAILDPSAGSMLYDAANGASQHALAIGNSPSGWDAEYFATRLALLQKCVKASKSGKLDLSRQEVKRCAIVLAVQLFKELSVWANVLIQEAYAELEKAI
jgi:hypothetical protein